MNYKRFQEIHQNLQADLKTISDIFHKASQKYWKLGFLISVDDDIDKWSGNIFSFLNF
jgi:hypothetical protein